MNHVTIRKASIEDLPQLRVFEQGVIEAERPFDKTLKKGSIEYYDLEAMIMAEHIELLVAEVKGKLIGSGYARIENAKTYLQHQKHAYLGFMYVLPAYRGQAINQKIIEALKHWAVHRQITEFRLDVYFENLPAIKAYEKAGFGKHMIEMRMSTNEH